MTIEPKPWWRRWYGEPPWLENPSPRTRVVVPVVLVLLLGVVLIFKGVTMGFSWPFAIAATIGYLGLSVGLSFLLAWWRTRRAR